MDARERRELEDMSAQHVQRHASGTVEPLEECALCGQSWPCDLARPASEEPWRKNLTFRQLRRANLERLPQFKNKHGGPAHSQADGSDWSLGEWVNATAGEHGELAEFVLLAAMTKALGTAGNLAKKEQRGDLTLAEIRQQIADELADVVTYADILAYRAGIDLGEAVREKWNRVSERVGSDLRV